MRIDKPSQPIAKLAGLPQRPSTDQIDSSSGLSKSPSPPPDPPESRFSETVAESVESFSHHGKKLGTLGLVTYATATMPLVALSACISTVPDVLLGPIAMGTMVGTLALASLEEKHIGIGKHLGALAGGVVGAGVGAVRGAFEKLSGPEAAAPERVELKQQMPGQAKVFRPVTQAVLDKTLGPITKRSKALELCELIGATASTLVFAYTVPAMIGNSIGGALGNALATTLIGPLSGMVVGGLVESSLGFGRGAGELVGRVLDKVQGPQGEAPPQEKPAPSEAGALKKGFLALNNVIAQPIIGFLLDTTMVGNRLLAQEPIQSMKFEERPVAQVNRQRLIENFVDLAGINGPSGQEGAISQELEKRMQKLGVSVKRHEDGTLVGSLPATPGYESSPTVMLSAHLDTVLPTRRENIIVGERRIHTNEKSILGADDRAGIAEILEGLESVLEQGLPHPEVKLVFPVDEERGLVGSSRLRPEDISTRPTLGYVVDALDVQDVHLTNDAVIVNPKSVKYAYSQDDPLVQVLYQSMANAGLKPRPIPAPIMTGAGSDANTPALNSGLIRSIAIGAGERDMHTTLEYIEKDHLEQAARHVVGVLTHSCDLKVEGDQIVPKYPMPTV